MKLFRNVLAVAAVFALTGCASFNVNEAKDRLGVQLATMGYIESGENHTKRAERVLEVVEETRTMMDFADVSVADIKVALLARIAERSNLTPLEHLAAQELVTYLSDEVEARLTRRTITVDDRVTVNAVLALVEGAAARYVSH
jgi:hypothetical protein